MISIEGKMIGYALIWLSKEFAMMKKKQKENVARFARMLAFLWYNLLSSEGHYLKIWDLTDPGIISAMREK